MNAPNDPDELLEVYDAKGNPTGVSKTREAIHRDGDWHLAFFCWIMTKERRVLVQRRSLEKDVWPGMWDASAAGHVRFGEGLSGALREIQEELGVPPPKLSELDFLGRFKSESKHENGIVCREHQDTFRWWSDRPLIEYRPGPEVLQLMVIDLDQIPNLGDRMVPHDPRVYFLLRA